MQAATKTDFIKQIQAQGYAKVDAETFRDWFGSESTHDAGLKRALAEIKAECTKLSPAAFGVAAIYLKTTFSPEISNSSISPSVIVYRPSDVRASANIE